MLSTACLADRTHTEPQEITEFGARLNEELIVSQEVEAHRACTDPTGPLITKLDELPQLWNVLLGQMSLVGPRPNVLRETAIYTPEEKRLLSVRPGMTDLASIVFADEGDILDASVDPDLKYNQVIRPWKSALGLAYVDGHGSVLLDLWIILLTLRAARNRVAALEQVARIAATLGATPELVAVARRRQPLRPTPPPGATTVVRDRTAPPA